MIGNSGMQILTLTLLLLKLPARITSQFGLRRSFSPVSLGIAPVTRVLNFAVLGTLLCDPPLFFWNSFFSLVGRDHSILSYLDNSTRSNLFPRLQSTHCCHRVRFCQSLLWTNPARLLPVSCFISVEATAYLAYQTPSKISFG